MRAIFTPEELEEIRRADEEIRKNGKDPIICRRKKCKYNNYDSKGEYGGSCDYCWVTGKTRTAQLTREELKPENCPLFDSGEKVVHKKVRPFPEVREKKPKVEKPRAEKTVMQKLYEAGLEDAEIGKRLCVSRQAIAFWRRKNKLPPNGQRRANPEEMMERERLYRKGLTDAEIAKETGCTMNTVQKWRYKRGLPKNGGAAAPGAKSSGGRASPETGRR